MSKYAGKLLHLANLLEMMYPYAAHGSLWRIVLQHMQLSHRHLQPLMQRREELCALLADAERHAVPASGSDSLISAELLYALYGR